MELTDSKDDRPSKRQSEQYQFPYHYLVSQKVFPHFSKYWTFSPSYIAALNLFEVWLAEALVPQRDLHTHIDIGCGDGALLNTLDIAKFRNLRLCGVDFDKRAISWAKMFSNGAEFSTNSLESLKDEFYDSGSLVEVLEHIQPTELPNFVSNVSRVLKKGAQLFVTVPSTEKALEKKHHQHFDFDSIEQVLGKDFKIIRISGFENRSILLRMLLRICSSATHYFEFRPLSSFLIKRAEKTSSSISGYGRIMVVLKKL